MNASEVNDDPTHLRFELIEDGKVAFADYHREGEVLELTHVEADLALRGSGAAGRLMDGLLAIVRRRGWRVRPLCGYAAAYIERHPEHHDLLA
ncbi:MAG: N-acetyltransferase [Verrucomicrobiae bacterium]|nr:N-acetyltransferase [Verrucomicrobiae bacterium]